MRRKQRGMTLVELIIGLGLMSIVLTVLYMIFFTGLKSFEQQTENANNQAAARQALSYIGREIRRSEEDITVNAYNNGLTVKYYGDYITYEFDDYHRTIYREKNGVKNPMIDGVKEFEIKEIDYVYNLSITCVTDRHDNPITVSTKIRKRE